MRTDVENSEREAIVKSFTAYPNPFNPETIIQYTIDDLSRVNLTIFNVKGQKILTLIDKVQEPSVYQVRWDGVGRNGYPAG